LLVSPFHVFIFAKGPLWTPF